MPQPKGKTGNPNGAPEKECTMAFLIKQAALEDKQKEERRQKKIAVVNSMYQKAIEGDVQAAKVLLSYDSGLPAQVHEHEGEITFNISYE